MEAREQTPTGLKLAFEVLSDLTTNIIVTQDSRAHPTSGVTNTDDVLSRLWSWRYWHAVPIHCSYATLDVVASGQMLGTVQHTSTVVGTQEKLTNVQRLCWPKIVFLWIDRRYTQMGLVPDDVQHAKNAGRVGSTSSAFEWIGVNIIIEQEVFRPLRTQIK